jgi:hypothetical protein
MHPPELVARFLEYDALIPAGILVKTDALRAVGGAEDRFRGSWEDAAMLVKLCLRFPAHISGEPTYRYRIHQDSCCRVEARLGQAERAHLDFLAWVESFLDAQDTPAPSVRAALDRASLPYRHPVRARLRDMARRGVARLNAPIRRG